MIATGPLNLVHGKSEFLLLDLLLSIIESSSTSASPLSQVAIESRLSRAITAIQYGPHHEVALFWVKEAIKHVHRASILHEDLDLAMSYLDSQTESCTALKRY